MAKNGDSQNVAIVGTEVIGTSWAARFLSSGFKVIATAPGPKARANLQKYIEEAWTTLENEVLKGLLGDHATIGR